MPGTAVMTLLLAATLVALGVFAPTLVKNRETDTWTVWFIRRISPGLCFGAAIGLLVAAIFKALR
jgi:hypothetical protein